MLASTSTSKSKVALRFFKNLQDGFDGRYNPFGSHEVLGSLSKAPRVYFPPSDSAEFCWVQAQTPTVIGPRAHGSSNRKREKHLFITVKKQPFLRASAADRLTPSDWYGGGHLSACILLQGLLRESYNPPFSREPAVTHVHLSLKWD